MISNATAQRLLDIFRKYLPDDQIKQLVDELMEVPGNKSFRDSMKLVDYKLTGVAHTEETGEPPAPFMKFRITVLALWLDPRVGSKGFIGAVLNDGTPVALCSKEKWDMGPRDSLRRGWIGRYRIGKGSLYCHHSLSVLRAGGLKVGDEKLTVPAVLENLVIRW